MCPALDRHAVDARRAEVAAVPSVRFVAECHPRLNFCWLGVAITHSLMDVLPATGFKPSNVYVELLSGALFTLCALAPLCTVTTGMDTTSPVVWAKSC